VSTRRNQGFVHVPEQIPPSNLIEQLGLPQCQERLRLNVRKEHHGTVPARAPHQIPKRVYSRRVNRRDMAHADEGATSKRAGSVDRHHRHLESGPALGGDEALD